MAVGDLFYQSFPIILDDKGNDPGRQFPGLTDIFPPDDFEIIGRHIINPTGSGGANRAVILIVARELSDVPDDPTLTQANTGGGSGEVDLIWTAPGNDGGASITDYLVEFATTVGGIFTEFPHAPSVATNISVAGLATGVSYDFRVSAINAKGTGTPSNILTATSS